jgi:crossover junction endodeoxyribonuclease RuvC
VIRAEQSHYQYLASGCIRTSAGSLATRLREIFNGLSQIIQRYRPETAAVEQVFMHRNAAAALKLGQARGAALSAIACQFVDVKEYSPREIKQAIAGTGAAEKEQIQYMIRCLLKLPKAPPADAADALGVAICHANTQQSLMYLSKNSKATLL